MKDNNIIVFHLGLWFGLQDSLLIKERQVINYYNKKRNNRHRQLKQDKH